MKIARTASEADARRTVLSQGWLARRSAETQARLLAIARLRTYEAGRYIYRAGAPGTALYGLIEGGLDLILPVHGRADIVAHRAEPGYWIGDLAVIAGRERLVSVRASQPTTMMVLPARALLDLLKKEPELHRDLYELTHDNMAMALRFLGEALAFTAVERIARRLAHFAQARGDAVDPWLELSQGDLAGMVGASLPTTQRAIRQLREAGLIDTGYGRLRILDPGRLAAFDEFPPDCA